MGYSVGRLGNLNAEAAQIEDVSLFFKGERDLTGTQILDVADVVEAIASPRSYPPKKSQRLFTGPSATKATLDSALEHDQPIELLRRGDLIYRKLHFAYNSNTALPHG